MTVLNEANAVLELRDRAATAVVLQIMNYTAHCLTARVDDEFCVY